MATPDPTGGGIGQAAGELLKEMQKAQAEMQKLEQKRGTGGPNEAFQNALQEAQQVQAGQDVAASGKAAGVLMQAKANQSLPSTKVGATEKAAESKLSEMLQNLISGQDKMTKIMNMALSGRQFSPPELLAMQAGVYRFTQELDLTTKVVEKATGGIKQTLNTQV